MAFLSDSIFFSTAVSLPCMLSACVRMVMLVYMMLRTTSNAARSGDHSFRNTLIVPPIHTSSGVSYGDDEPGTPCQQHRCESHHSCAWGMCVILFGYSSVTSTSTAALKEFVR